MYVCLEELCGKEFDEPGEVQEACDCCTGPDCCPHCESLDIDERTHITHEALREAGFRIENKADDIWRLAVAHRKVGKLSFMESPDDLCIDVSPLSNSKGTAWYVWIVQVEPSRHIHIRHLRYMEDLGALYCGLTGKSCPPWIGV